MENFKNIIILLGIPAIISTIIPMLLKRYWDKKDKKKDDIAELKEDIAELKESREEYENVQKEIRDSMHRMEERLVLYEDAIGSLLRERIIQMYNHYITKQSMPIYARESLDRMRRDYNILNKDGADAIDPLIEKLYNLPTDD